MNLYHCDMGWIIVFGDIFLAENEAPQIMAMKRNIVDLVGKSPLSYFQVNEFSNINDVSIANEIFENLDKDWSLTWKTKRNISRVLTFHCGDLKLETMTTYRYLAKFDMNKNIPVPIKIINGYRRFKDENGYYFDF